MTITIVPSLLEPCRELAKFDTNCVKNYDLDAIVSAGYEHHSESSAFVIVQRALQGTQASNSGSESTSRPEKLGLMRVKLENCIAEREGPCPLYTRGDHACVCTYDIPQRSGSDRHT